MLPREARRLAKLLRANVTLAALNLISYLGTFRNAAGDVDVMALTFTTGL